MAHLTIILDYDATKGVTATPDPIRIKTGDTMCFASVHGPVNILFEPGGVFSKDQYTTGDDPVGILSAAKSQFWCGIVVNGQTFGFPANKDFGHTVDI
jgi:hypothetical protein